MKTMAINEAVSRHGGNTLREVIENMARSGEYHDIWLYTASSGGPAPTSPHTHFLCATKSDDTRQVVAFLMRGDVRNDSRVYEKGAIKKSMDPELDRVISHEKPADVQAKKEQAVEDQSRPRAVTPAWYFAKSESKHTRQVVITLPGNANISPRVSNLMGDLAFMQANWAVFAVVSPCAHS